MCPYTAVYATSKFIPSPYICIYRQREREGGRERERERKREREMTCWIRFTASIISTFLTWENETQKRHEY